MFLEIISMSLCVKVIMNLCKNEMDPENEKRKGGNYGE